MNLIKIIMLTNFTHSKTIKSFNSDYKYNVILR